MARLEQLEDIRDRRQTRPARAAERTRSARAARSDDPTVEIPRSTVRAAEKAYQAQQRAQERADRKAREQAGNQQRKAEAAERAMVARLAKKADRMHDKSIRAYMGWGMDRTEAEDMYARSASGDYDDPEQNPRRRRRRNPEGTALAIAAGILAVNPAAVRAGEPSLSALPKSRHPNPSAAGGSRLDPARCRLCGRRRDTRYGVCFDCATAAERGRNPIVADLALELAKSGLMAVVQEEFKQARNQLKARHGQPIGERPGRRRRSNPARLEPEHDNARLREISKRFHGVETEILHLDPEQRRPPPVHVVKIGEERATVYRPSRASDRGGNDWEHESGDQGEGQRNARGNRILVADEHGRVYLVRGDSSMYFDPDRGLVK